MKELFEDEKPSKELRSVVNYFELGIAGKRHQIRKELWICLPGSDMEYWAIKTFRDGELQPNVRVGKHAYITKLWRQVREF